MGSIHSCRNCEDRYPGCHDVCEKYQTERKRLDEENNARRKMRNTEFDSYWSKKKFRRRK